MHVVFNRIELNVSTSAERSPATDCVAAFCCFRVLVAWRDDASLDRRRRVLVPYQARTCPYWRKCPIANTCGVAPERAPNLAM
ncbi:hypothetical protein AWZ03_001955 [Drosophila navojoa]|uniref:Uncharacterized protein n=1 Tax=Drosophila navojoa TaxID=7232 RepID=A0A484BUE0_DRONA|nr:hypothetical protein AWZ03_001955 [Drosophila navojoa]